MEGHMDISHSKLERVLKKHLQEWEESYHAGIQAWLPRVRKSLKDPERLPANASVSSTGRPTLRYWNNPRIQDKSPFAGLSASTKNSDSATSQQVPMTSVVAASNNILRFSATVNVTKYQDEAVQVPPYTHHVQLNSNVVTENSRKLNHNPMEIVYGDRDWSPDEYERQLSDVYTRGVPWDREKLLEDVESSKHLRQSVLVALSELGCSVADVLCYIIDPPSAKKVDSPVQLGLQKNWDRWATLPSTLPATTDRAQALAADFCETFEKLTQFSIWHVVKDEKPAESNKTEDAFTLEPRNYSSLMCRVCFCHLCTAHGEFEEDYEKATEKNDSIALDPGSINYRLGVTRPGGHRDFLRNPAISRNSELRRPYQYWLKMLELYNQAKSEGVLANSLRGQFYPCSHEGPCDQAMCSCYVAGINCEKTCECSVPCARRFTGCNCVCLGVVCWRSPNCACSLLERECDPDLCIKCGAAEVLEPNRRAKNNATKRLCGNVSIQLGASKRMLLGRSLVAGFGLFTGETIRKGEFLGEYKGELLSEAEADRRQILNQHLREYLFVMNKDQQVDSTVAGNKIRFVNNSCSPQNINCHPAPLLCNGVIRMGLFASRDLKIGEELFFKYGYTDEQVATFKEVAQTMAPKTANSAAGKLRKDSGVRRQLRRQSMNATSARPQEYKLHTRRVIDDSEASSANEESINVEDWAENDRRGLVDLHLEESSESHEELSDDGAERTGDEVYSENEAEQLHMQTSSHEPTRLRWPRDRKRKR